MSENLEENIRDNFSIHHWKRKLHLNTGRLKKRAWWKIYTLKGRVLVGFSGASPNAFEADRHASGTGRAGEKEWIIFSIKI